VLADTFELHYQTWVAAFAGYNLPFSQPLYHRAFGMNNKDLITAVLGQPGEPEFVTRVTEQKERAFQQAAPGLVRTCPGVPTWLDQAIDLGLSPAVASAAPQGNIELLVDALSFAHFSALVSGFAIPGKPDRQVFLEAARLLATSPEHCLVIETRWPAWKPPGGQDALPGGGQHQPGRADRSRPGGCQPGGSEFGKGGS
jgi:beta-phosphoglucomutase-like phosphatase (HAD superfamily)